MNLNITIIGLGKMGSALATRLHLAGMIALAIISKGKKLSHVPCDIQHKFRQTKLHWDQKTYNDFYRNEGSQSIDRGNTLVSEQTESVPRKKTLSYDTFLYFDNKRRKEYEQRIMSNPIVSHLMDPYAPM